MIRTSRIILAITLVASTASLKAQDTLIMKNGSKIPSKVLEITPNDIKYKKADNVDGPTYTTSNNEIDFVKYKNGTVDTIKAAQATAITIKKTPTVQPPADPHPAIYRFGPAFKYAGGGMVNAKGAQRIMLTVNDPEINDHIRKAKFSKGMGFVGFVAIPTFIFAVGYSFVEYVNYPNTGEYWPGVASGAAAVACLGTAITFNVRKKKNMNAALKIYNEKY